LGASTALSFVLQKRWTPYRQNLTLPLKAFFPVAATIFCVVVGADRAGQAYERSRYDVGKINRESAIEGQLGLGGSGAVDTSGLSLRDKSIEWIRSNRYRAVAGAWAVSMVGSFSYIATTPLSFAQKLVQARMIAQGLTVGVLLASAGLAALPTANSAKRDAYDQEMREDALYKFKKGSPHDLSHKQHAQAFTEAK